ncbi:MAG: hypothetical protein IV092_05830 [Burkholderiaceae bacterium]|nr:hypothetical protein [Burkholderiaceae bacterium]
MATLRARLPSLWQSRPFSLEAYPRLLRSGLQLSAQTKRVQRLLLSRALYRVKSYPLSDVPAAERRSVLRNLLLAWGPFDQSDYAVVIGADSALAFAWDARVIADAMQQATPASTWTPTPEGLLRPVMQGGQGLRLIACLEGYELQQWRDGALLASRWWSHQPSVAEQIEFLRTVGEDESAGISRVSDTPWQGQPWAEALGVDELSSNWSRTERLAAGATLICLAGLTGVMASDMRSAYHSKEVASAELDRAKLAAAPVLSARDRALEQARALDGLARQLTGAQPLEVMQHLARLLPPRGAVLKELELNGSKLRVGLELAPDVQRGAIVKALQAGAWFTNVGEVRESGGRNWVSFEMTLSSLLPPADRPAEPPPSANSLVAPGGAKQP